MQDFGANFAKYAVLNLSDLISATKNKATDEDVGYVRQKWTPNRATPDR